jgi:CheY-like chemotaxis protein
VSTAPPSANPDDYQEQRILIIDDNPRIHRDFELVLLDESENSELDADERRLYGLKPGASAQRPSYCLDHAHSGLEGIDKTKQAVKEGRFYQLAFVDIRMPGIDGVETIERIWQVDPNMQIVICTAYADYSQEDLIRRLGHTDKLLLLKKPFDSIEVTQLARTLTEKWRLARQAALKLEQMELLVSQRTQKILALQRQQSPPPLEPTPATSANDPEKLSLILLVEHHADLALNIHQLLGCKYQIIEAQDTQTGLEKALELVPDLIVIDIFLPHVDGVGLCNKLKAAQLTSHIPVILAGVREPADHQLKALESGADDYITPSTNLSTLDAHVENLLESRNKLRASLEPQAVLRPRELAVSRTDALFLQRVMAVVDRNMSDFEFDVDALARSVAVSRRQLFRKLKGVVNTTPKAFIRSVRLKRAAQLLLHSEMTITEITFAVGFQDVKHFRALFKEQFGVLPSDYIKEKESASACVEAHPEAPDQTADPAELQ